jgi:CBS domain-containing protein
MTIETILKQKGTDVATIEPEASIRRAADRLRVKNIGALVVTSGKAVLGIISEREIVHAFSRYGETVASMPVKNTIMKSETQRGRPRRHATKAFWRLCASVAFFGVVSPASADMVTVTYTGTVHDGFDQLGVFGTPSWPAAWPAGARHSCRCPCQYSRILSN